MATVFCTQNVEWIKLSDELPPDGKEVLLTDFDTTISGRLYFWENDEGGEDMEVYRSEDVLDDMRPQCWAKLPVPAPF